MSGRALVVHATHLLFMGSQVSGDPGHALGAAVGALRRALAFKEPARAVAVLDDAPDLAAWPAPARPLHDLLPRVLEAHGVPTVRAADAIQVVASYVQAALDDGLDVVVVGSDKRLAQLVAADVWWYDAYKRVRYTPELVRKRFEVLPDVVAGWLALVGDRDALPGVKGIGKKGATELIRARGSLDAALAAVDELEGRTGKALRAAHDDAVRELGRAVLDRARPLPVALDDLPFTPPTAEDLNALYAELGFHHLVEAEGPRIDTRVCDTPEAVAALLAALGRPPAVLAVTGDPSAARGELVGLALARGDVAGYVPLSRIEALQAMLEDPSEPKVGHDTKSLRVALARVGITLAGVVGDSEVGSHLTDPTGLAPHDLPDVARRVLHLAVPEHDATRGVGRARRRWAGMKPATVAGHWGPWASASDALWQRFAPGLDAARLAETLALGETLAGMELRGFACDADDLARSAADFAKLGEEVQGRIHALAGREFNVGSTKQLGSVLYEDLGLPVMKRTKTGWSTATSALERIEGAHPIVPLVMRWRRVRWLRSTWTDALTKAIDPDGRIRATFHHARSFSGRVIVSNPDLGRVPGRTPEMVRIRHAFHAPPGSTLLSVDYDQLGLYVLAHLSGDDELCGSLRRGADLHRITASAVLGVDHDAMTHDERQIGKVVNFATFAGQGASALALQLGVAAAEAKTIIAKFYEHYWGVKAFQDGEVEKARRRGFIETIAGRRQQVSGFESLDNALRSYADRVGRRATHEGSVADVTRRALLATDVALRDAGLRAFPVLQMLDEVLFEVPEDEVEDALAVTVTAMRGTYDLRIPLRVTATVGDRWGAMQPIDVPPR